MAHLNAAQLETIRARCGKIADMEYNSHQLVFRRPSRDEISMHRRRQEDPAEKVGSLDLFSQIILAAFDGEEDPVKARALYGAFLDEHPAFTSNRDKFLPAIAILCGMVEDEAAASLGKGVSVRSAPPPSTQTA